MNSTTNKLIGEIKRKLKNRHTGEPEYKTYDQIVDAAITNFYNQLKRNKEL